MIIEPHHFRAKIVQTLATSAIVTAIACLIGFPVARMVWASVQQSAHRIAGST